MLLARGLTIFMTLLTFAFDWAKNVQGEETPLGKIQQPSGIPSLGNFVTALIRLIIIAGFITAFVFLLIGGIQWIVAGGEPKATQAARAKVTAAIVGLAIVISSFVIIKAVERFFDISIISGGSITLPVP